MTKATTADPKAVTADARMAMETREMGKAAWETAEAMEVERTTAKAATVMATTAMIKVV